MKFIDVESLVRTTCKPLMFLTAGQRNFESKPGLLQHMDYFTV